MIDKDKTEPVDQEQPSSQQLAEEQRRISEIGRIVSSSLDIADVYPIFAEHARALVRADRMVIAIISEDQTEFVDQYIDGVNVPGSAIGSRRKIVDNPAHKSLLNDPTPVVFAGSVFEDLNSENPEERFRRESGLQSLMHVPLFWQGNPFGVIAFRAFAADAFGSHQAEIGQQISSQIAGAIATALQYAELEREVQQRALLADIGRIVSSTTDLDSAFTSFVEAANKLIPFDRLAISEIDAESNEIFDAHVGGFQLAEGNLSGRTSLEDSVVPSSVLNDHSILIANAESLKKRSIDDVANDNRSRIEAGLISAMFVPVVLQGTIVGTLVFRSRHPDPYNDEHRRLAEQIAAHLSGIIASRQQRKVIQTESLERQRLAEEQYRLSEIGRMVTSTLSLSEVFSKFEVQARELLPFERLVLVTLTEDKSKIAVELSAGIGQEIRTEGEVLVRSLNPLQAKALASGEPVVLNGEELISRAKTIKSEQLRVDEGLNSVLMSPLVWQGSVIGLITFRSTSFDAYGEHEVSLATQISAQIAGAVAMSNQYRLLEDEYQQREQIAEIGRIVSSTLELDEVFTRFLDVARNLLQFDRIAIITLSEDGSSVIDNLVDGVDSNSAPAGAVLSINDNPIQRRVFEEATEIVYSGDEYRELVENEPAEKVRFDAGLVSVLMVPMLWQGEVIGVINFRSKQENAYGENEIKIAKQIGAQIAGAVAMSNQYRLLEESETNYRGLVENTHILVWRMDAKGRFTYVNKSLEDALGYTSEEMLGRRYTDFTPNRDDPNIDQQVREHFAERAENNYVRAGNTIYLHKNGSEVHFAFSSGSLFDSDGKFVGVRGTALDTTSEREAQDAIKIQTAAIEAASDAVIVVLPDSSIRYVNDAFVEQTGYSREEAIGQSSNILRVPGGDLRRYELVWETVQQGREWHGTQLSRRKDGSVFTVEVSITPVFAEDGTISSYVAIRRDVTERIQAEQDRQARAELDAQNQQLLEIDKQREEFFSSVSHELRTPLTAVTAFSDILSRNRDENLNETQLEQLDVIKRNSRSLISLVEDMLDMSRLNSSTLRIERAPIEIDELVRSTAESLEPTARERQQSIEIRSETKGVLIDADKGRLVQVLSNLITNASKYSPDNSSIKVCSEINDGTLELRVVDTGFGMSSEDLRMVFSPFYRSTRDEIQSRPGTGLGMAISKTLIELHDGQIEVDSTINVGTTVTVKIPGVILE